MSPERKAEGQQVTLKIPRPLYDQLKQVIADSGFHSVTEFAVYVLRDLVSHHASSAGRPTPEGVEKVVTEDPDPLTPAEIEAIRKRLTSLGYL